jgi:hypothetical protein
MKKKGTKKKCTIYSTKMKKKKKKKEKKEMVVIGVLKVVQLNYSKTDM